jgi:hypothetical protein
MSVEITVKLTNAEAEAVLKSEGLHNGWGVRKSKSLKSAENKLLDAIKNKWNEMIEERSAADD